MNRICIAALMTVMICASGCGPSEREIEATEKLLSAWVKRAWDKGQGPKADYIRVLISEGADVNARSDVLGRTPLMYAAARYSNPEIVTLLIEAGADVNAKVNNGLTPLMLAARYTTTPEIVTLLIQAGADVNTKDENGLTPLWFANHLSGSYPEIIKILEAAGARE
jgi:ankyrin repeat protein